MDINKSGMIKANSNKFAVLYRLVDILWICLALPIACLTYSQTLTTEYSLMALLTALCFALAAESVSLYRSWRVAYLKELMFYVFVSWGIAMAALLLALFGFKISESFSRMTLAIWFTLTLVGLAGWRVVFNLFLKEVRKRGYNTRNIALFGCSEKGMRLLREIENNPELGLKVSAIFDDRQASRLPEKYRSLHAGNTKEGIEFAKQNLFDTVYIALPISSQKRIHDMLYGFGDTTATVHVVPDLFMYTLMHGELSHVGEMQTISVYDNPMSGAAAMFKRIEDIVMASIIMCVIAIPMLVIAAAVKFTSPGPIIFKQYRYGLNGKKIEVWKFRSMTVTENSDVVTQATKNDMRITPVGAFIRRTSLDELPQFINVLQGTMSVIGPRPHAVSHNESYRKQVDYYMLRHKVKPGITGWAQVNGWRGETDTVDKMEKRIEYDLEYIRNWSLWLDFKIMLMTFVKGFRNENAY